MFSDCPLGWTVWRLIPGEGEIFALTNQGFLGAAVQCLLDLSWR